MNMIDDQDDEFKDVGSIGHTSFHSNNQQTRQLKFDRTTGVIYREEEKRGIRVIEPEMNNSMRSSNQSIQINFDDRN